jgi:hypothetical protein
MRFKEQACAVRAGMYGGVKMIQIDIIKNIMMAVTGKDRGDEIYWYSLHVYVYLIDG